jgi:tRNA acetyltransferase TAN1
MFATLSPLTWNILKKNQGKKSWTTPKQHNAESSAAHVPSARKQIEPGDAGIWATCSKGREAKCVTELKNLFQEVSQTQFVQQ